MTSSANASTNMGVGRRAQISFEQIPKATDPQTASWAARATDVSSSELVNVSARRACLHRSRSEERAASIWKKGWYDGQPVLMEAVMDLHRQLTDLCDAFNAHDLDLIMTYFAEDCILEMPRGHDPWGSRFEGKAKVREALAMRFRGLPDVTYNDAEHFVDEACETGISRWRLTGTAVNGAGVKVHGCDFYTFRDGQVIRKDSYWKIVE
jgi:ketosteroid isomerase-like protein